MNAHPETLKFWWDGPDKEQPQPRKKIERYGQTWAVLTVSQWSGEPALIEVVLVPPTE